MSLCDDELYDVQSSRVLCDIIRGIAEEQTDLHVSDCLLRIEQRVS